MPDKLVKDVVIARSGIYKYGDNELKGMGLDSVPEKYKNKHVFNVYRPAIVLEKAADKFVRLPLTLEHPRDMVDGTNFKKYAVGFTGDSSFTKIIKGKDDELAIQSTLTLIDNSAVRAYYTGTVEVSPGYSAIFDWQEGKAPNGDEYQIIMSDIKDVNHLALTKYGRGGSAAAILDSIGDKIMAKSYLLHFVHKMLGVRDTVQFSKHVESFIKDRVNLKDEDVTDRISKLREYVSDLPESENKEKLDRFISDMAMIREESDESAKAIGGIINKLYATLDAESEEEVREKEPKKEKKEEEKEGVKKAEEKEGEKKKEEESKDDEKDSKDKAKDKAKDEKIKDEDKAKDEKIKDEDKSSEKSPEKKEGKALKEESEVKKKEDKEHDTIDDSVFEKDYDGLKDEEMKYISKKMYDSFRKGIKDSKDKEEKNSQAKDSLDAILDSLTIHDNTPRYPGTAKIDTSSIADNPIEDIFNKLGVK